METMIGTGFDQHVRADHFPEWRVTVNGRVVDVISVDIDKRAGRNPRTNVDVRIVPGQIALDPRTNILVDVHWRVNGHAWIAVADSCIVLTVTDERDGTRIEAKDLSAVMLGVDGQWRPPKGPALGDAVDALVSGTLKGKYRRSPVWAWPADATVDAEELVVGSVWNWITEWASDADVEVFFDHDGRLAARAKPTVGAPVAALDDGVVVSWSKQVRRMWDTVELTYRLARDPFPEWDTDQVYEKGDKVAVSGVHDDATVRVFRALNDVGKKAPTPPNANWTQVDTFRRFVRGRWRRAGAPSWGAADLAVERTRARLKTLPSQAVADKRAAALGARMELNARMDRVDVIPQPWLEPGDTVALPDGQPALIRQVALASTGTMTIETERGY